MNILFDTDAIQYPLTRIGRYAFEIGSRLSSAKEIEQALYFRDGTVQEEMAIRSTVAGRAERARMRIKRWAGSMPFFSKAYHNLAAKQQERSFSKLNEDNFVFHGPNYALPTYDGASVATIHNLSAMSWPECHSKKNLRRMKKDLQTTIKRASTLIADSKFTRKEIIDHFGFPADRIIVAPLAVSSAYHPMTRTETMPVLTRQGLTFGAYSLFVGAIDARRKVDSLIDVYERLPDNLRQRIPLVVTGEERIASAKTIHRLRAAEKEGWARYLGFIDEAALPSIYAGARVFVFPSHYEGFGLPVLEAMTSGAPVICSNLASLSEITNGSMGATLIATDDNNNDQLHDAILRALNEDEWCSMMHHRSLECARHFSWDRTLAATISAYKLALT